MIQNKNILSFVIIGAIVIAFIYYMTKSDDKIENDGIVNQANSDGESDTVDRNREMSRSAARLVRPPQLENRRADDVTGSLVDDVISQYTVEDRPMEGGTGSFKPDDPMASDLGEFNGYGRKRQLNMKKMEKPFVDDENDPRNFSYKKKAFTLRTPDDVKELFDINKMLPQEIEEDWFDVEPLQTTKKIRGTHLIHPKVHMGVNTVGSSLRNATHDIRGDIPNPKLIVSPWNNSTIEPDTNIKGICNPI